nr:hypothetical protein [Tanacetum cinerariifolium]
MAKSSSSSENEETKEKLLRPQLVGFGDLNKILLNKGNSQNNIDDKGYWDSGCSRHMTGNISYLSEYEPYDGGYVLIGQGGGKITGKDLLTKPFDVGRFQYLVFWSTARIETTNQETKILATIDGKPRTISESSLRRHLKLKDEEGISSLPDAELFENLSLMGYNILPNQRFTFQKGQFSHQWNNISIAVVCLATNMVYNFSKMIFDGMVKAQQTHLSPHHTPSPQEHHSPQHDSLTPSHPNPTTEQIPLAPTKPFTHRQYTRRAKRITQSQALSPTADEPASLSRDDKEGEAFPTVSSLDAGHDRENINKTSALPHESSPRVTSLDADEGNRERRSAEPTQEDAPITWGIMEIGEELGVDKSTELGSNDTKEMVNVPTSMEAANILTSGVAAASVSPIVEVLPAAGVPTISGSVPIQMRSPIVGAKDKGKQKVVESEVPKKRKLQEQIDAQVAREMEEEFTRENQRESEQLARDSEIARLHAEEELKMMVEGLDRKNEMIAKHLQEYEQAADDLSSKPLSKKEKMEYYMSILRSHAGWKTKHFRGITMKEIKEKSIPVWKQLEDFMPMSSKEEDMLKQFDREDLHQLWTLVKETFSIRQATKYKEKELWVELKRLFEPDFKDQLWTHNQAFMHDPLEWKLHDTCGVHHVFTKDQEIFMLVEKDYPLRKRIATVMI